MNLPLQPLLKLLYLLKAKGCHKLLKKFVDEAFAFFEQLSDDRITHKQCTYSTWKWLDYRCTTYKKKYVVAYLSQPNEIVTCDFVAAKLLK